MINRVAEWAQANREIQLELATVINHNIDAPIIRTHKSGGDAQGIHLAKLLRQYDESPSSALWSEIQSAAREVLR